MTMQSTEQPEERPVRTILIANRSEIASRIIRTCKALGKSTVAVFSDADRSLPYVRQADEAFRLGPAPATESYLSVDAILNAARATGADAIHPGYGFLSESSEFARAVQNAGLTWIGPNPESIDAIGDKRKAKELLSTKAPEVPLVPGYHGKEQSADVLARHAQEIGTPLLIKAAAGGGGKGMRTVHNLRNFLQDLSAAQGEAQRSFGSRQVLLERYFETIKHVEVQIIGDVHGNIVSLGTRECSMQRRHQKVIEEAPAPPHLLKGNGESALDMEACAVLIGKTVQYVGVGTVEFLVDVSSGRFYFLEVNTRLQVEHTVSEQVTGLDLVQLQVHVAEGRALDDILPESFLLGAFTPKLHSIQCRLYAEDANNNFSPSTGTIVAFSPPANDICRVEAGVESGSTVSVYYDAMVAKLITTAPVRSQAISKMVSAINDCILLGVTTNLEFLKTLLLDPAFATHTHTTNTIERILADQSHARQKKSSLSSCVDASYVATVWHYLFLNGHFGGKSVTSSLGGVPIGWRNVPSGVSDVLRSSWFCPTLSRSCSDEQRVDVSIQVPRQCNSASLGPIQQILSASTLIGDQASKVQFELLDWDLGRSPVITMRMLREGRVRHFYVFGTSHNSHQGGAGTKLFVRENTRCDVWSLELLPKCHVRSVTDQESGAEVRAIMPCRVLRVEVQSGQTVAKGDVLMVVESMKMETRIAAPTAGVVDIHVKAGSLVEAQTLMVRIKSDDK